MQKKGFVMGILSLALVFGLLFSGCNSDDSTPAPTPPAVTDITFTKSGDSLAAGSAVGTFSATGGTGHSFELVADASGATKDNAKFVMDATDKRTLKIAADTTLTRQTTYNVVVKATNSEGQSKVEGKSFTAGTAQQQGTITVYNDSIKNIKVVVTSTVPGSQPDESDTITPYGKYTKTFNTGEYTIKINGNTTALSVTNEPAITVGIGGLDKMYSAYTGNGRLDNTPQNSLPTPIPAPEVSLEIKNSSTDESDIIGKVEVELVGAANQKNTKISPIAYNGSDTWKLSAAANTKYRITLTIKRGDNVRTGTADVTILNDGSGIKYTGASIEALDATKVTVENAGVN